MSHKKVIALFYILFAFILFYVGYPMMLIFLDGAIVAIDLEDYASWYERILCGMIGTFLWFIALKFVWKAYKKF